jgi:hypothetical protein
MTTKKVDRELTQAENERAEETKKCMKTMEAGLEASLTLVLHLKNKRTGKVHAVMCLPTMATLEAAQERGVHPFDLVFDDDIPNTGVFPIAILAVEDEGVSAVDMDDYEMPEDGCFHIVARRRPWPYMGKSVQEDARRIIAEALGLTADDIKDIEKNIERKTEVAEEG